MRENNHTAANSNTALHKNKNQNTQQPFEEEKTQRHKQAIERANAKIRRLSFFASSLFALLCFALLCLCLLLSCFMLWNKPQSSVCVSGCCFGISPGVLCVWVFHYRVLCPFVVIVVVVVVVVVVS